VNQAVFVSAVFQLCVSKEICVYSFWTTQGDKHHEWANAPLTPSAFGARRFVCLYPEQVRTRFSLTNLSCVVFGMLLS
jgi:hypothetical protein